METKLLLTKFTMGPLYFLALLVVLNSGCNRGTSVEIAEQAVCKIHAYDAQGSPLGTGTGFFINENQIATNYHVVEGAEMLYASLSGDSAFKVFNTRSQVKSCDVAILQSEISNESWIDVESMADPTLGDEVIVLGHPIGLPVTLSKGIISSAAETEDMFQISAPISPGSSGSPILNQYGLFVGIATASMNGQNLNFGTPASCLSKYIASEEQPESLSEYHLADGGQVDDLSIVAIRQLNNVTEVVLKLINVNIHWDPMVVWYEGGKLVDNISGKEFSFISSSLPSSRDNAVSVQLGEVKFFTATFEKVSSLSNLSLVDDFDSWSIPDIKVGSDINLDELTSRRTRVTDVISQLSYDEVLSSLSNDEWMDMDPSQYEASIILGAKLYADGDVEEARDVFEVIAKNSVTATPHFNLHKIYSEYGLQTKALEAISTACRIEPNSADLLNFKLNELWNQERLNYRLILETANELIDLDKDDFFLVESHYSRTYAMLALDEEDAPQFCFSMRRLYYGTELDWVQEHVRDFGWRCEL